MPTINNNNVSGNMISFVSCAIIGFTTVLLMVKMRSKPKEYLQNDGNEYKYDGGCAWI